MAAEAILALAAASQALSALPAGDAGRPALEARHADLQAKINALLAGPEPRFERWGAYRVKVTPGRLLGSGLTARVYLAEREGAPYALKRYASVEGLSAADQEAIQSAASAELTLWMQLRHPHIVRAFGEVEDAGAEICLALEYAPGASAKARMREPGAARVGLLPLDVLAWVARDIAEALVYLHGDPLGDGPVVHRDIKPGNIVFTSEGEAKLTDFGAAALLHVIKEKSRVSRVGTVAFMAPEMHAGEAASPRSDVWMYGATLLCLLTGEELADDLRVNQAFNNLAKPWELEDHVHCRLQGLNSDEELVPLVGLGLSEEERGVWEAAPAELRDLIQGCLRKRSKDRLSAEALRAHPFVATVEARYWTRRPTPPLPWLPQWPFLEPQKPGQGQGQGQEGQGQEGQGQGQGQGQEGLGLGLGPGPAEVRANDGILEGTLGSLFSARHAAEVSMLATTSAGDTFTRHNSLLVAEAELAKARKALVALRATFQETHCKLVGPDASAAARAADAAEAGEGGQLRLEQEYAQAFINGAAECRQREAVVEATNARLLRERGEAVAEVLLRGVSMTPAQFRRTSGNGGEIMGVYSPAGPAAMLPGESEAQALARHATALALLTASFPAHIDAKRAMAIQAWDWLARGITLTGANHFFW